MKKSRMVLCYVAIGLIAIMLLSATIVFYDKSSNESQKQFEENADYILKTKEDPISVMKDAIKDGQSPLKSYYLGYDFENPQSYWAMGAYSFYSELRNTKGEILAEYQPYLLLKGKTADGKNDYRIILFDEDYTVVSKDSTGKTKEWGNNTDPFEMISLFGSQKLEAEGVDPNCGKPLEIYGTCDDTFIYVEKMVWYNTDFGEVYTYTTNSNASKKGKIPVENWIKSLKDKKFIMETENLPDSFSEGFETDNEAKDICKKLSEAYIKAGCDSSKLVKPEIEKDEKTYVVQKVENIGDGCFVSSAFVIHPSNEAGIPTKEPDYLKGGLLSIGWIAGIAAICFLYRKSNGTKKVEEDNTEAEEA
ncbi:MAG: hypothetical protein J6D06_04585 [Clostridia bacterium]|nr:hypothetical protein [Clostridia bacterium]